MSSRARELFTLSSRNRRYINPDDLRDLEEIADADTLEDETQTSWREWLGNNTTLVIAMSFLGIALLAFLAWQASRFIPAIVSNPYVQAIAAATVLLGAGFRFGSKRKGAKIGRQWRLNIRKNDDESVTRLGTYVDGHGGGYFVPIKGFRRGEPRPFTVGELEASFGESLAKPGMSKSDPAIILLHPKYTNVRRTEHGNYVDVRTDSLQPAQDSPVAALKTTVPEYDEADINELAREAEKNAKRAKRAEDENETLRDAYQELLGLFNEPVDERVDELLTQHKELALALRGDRRAIRHGDAANGNGDGSGSDFRGADVSSFGPMGTTGTAGAEPNQEAIDEVEDELDTEADDD